MTEFTNYAQFNNITVTGRIAKAAIQSGKNGEFFAATVLTTLTTNGQTAAFNFLDSSGLMALFNSGYLPVGRQVTLSGHIAEMKETYTNKQGALVQTSPQIRLTGVTIPDGGLGPMPARKTATAAGYETPDPAPAF